MASPGAVQRQEADNWDGRGIIRIAHCWAPDIKGIALSLKDQLKIFGSDSWIAQYKNTEQPTENNVSRDEAKCILYVTETICYYIDWYVNDEYVDSELLGCVKHIVGCAIWTGGGTPSGGGTGSDDSDPCEPPSPTPADDNIAKKEKNIPGCKASCEDDPTMVCKDPQDPEPNPCDDVEELENDSTFISKMDKLQSDAHTKNYETGYLLTRQPDGSYSYEDVAGDPNDAFIGFNVSSPISAMIHSHYQGLLSIFSPRDIYSIYQLYQAGGMVNINTFFTGLVTAQGTTYLLKVRNASKFLSFANTFLSDAVSRDYFDKTYGELYDIGRNKSASHNEKAFLNMLRKLNTGLMLFKQESNGSWQAKKYYKGQVIDGGCN